MNFAMLLLAVYAIQSSAALPHPAPPDTALALVTDSLFNQAELFLSRGNLTSAEECFQKLISSGDEPRGSLGLGKVALIRGDWAEARRYCDKALELNAHRNSTEAHYYAAVSNRESARWRNPYDVGGAQGISEGAAYAKAEDCFRWILQRDSTYQDVLYQYALLLKDLQRFGEAMHVLCAELRMKSGMPVALLGAQRLFAAAAREGQAKAVLEAIPRDLQALKEYLHAEALRKEGLLPESEALLRGLLANQQVIPVQLVYRSLVRIYAKRNAAQQLEMAYWEGVNAIEDETGAFLLFEDLKYILSPSEIFKYLNNREKPGRDSFFHLVWNRRNPTPGSPWNPRLVEHYQRLVHAEGHYACDREQFSFLYNKGRPGLNFDLSDAGVVYMRNGAPDEVMGLDLGARVEAWRYNATETGDEMIFRFFGVEKNFSAHPSGMAPRPMHAGEGGLRHLATPPRPLESPGRSDYEPLDAPPKVWPLPVDLIFWDPDYFYVWRGTVEESRLQSQRAEFRLETGAIASFMQGFTTERDGWSKSVRFLELSSTVSAFRDGDARTMLDVAYVVPGNSLLKEAGDSVKSLSVESGFAVYDRNWRKIVSTAETLSVSRTTSESNTYMRLQQAMVKPDSYYVAVYARPLGYDVVGRSERTVFAPNFWQSQMGMSDLQLALDIRKATDFSVFDKGGLRVVVSPSQRHPTNRPLYIYFELYNPTRVKARETNLNLDLTIRPLKPTGGFVGSIVRLFGEKKGFFVASEVERWNSDETLAKYLVVDVTKMDPGDYVLDVGVTDRVTGKAVTRSLNLQFVAKAFNQ